MGYCAFKQGYIRDAEKVGSDARHKCLRVLKLMEDEMSKRDGRSRMTEGSHIENRLNVPEWRRR